MRQKISIFLFLFPSLLWAQSYNTAAGIRVGSGLGMSVQQRISEKTTIEGIAQRKWVENSPTTVTALLRRHKAIKGRALNAYMGVGAHRTWTEADDMYGVDGIVGVEGTIFYLNTSLDYRPLWNVNVEKGNYQGQVGVTVRYVIKQAPYIKKKAKKGEKEYYNPPPQPKWT